jgi:RNA polymerase sigma-70 factor (TIGR02952 family)
MSSQHATSASDIERLARQVPRGPRKPTYLDLTSFERDILELLAEGRSFEEIAVKLDHEDDVFVRRHVYRLLGLPPDDLPDASADRRQVDEVIERSSLGEGVAPALRSRASRRAVDEVLAYSRRKIYAQRARQLLAAAENPRGEIAGLVCSAQQGEAKAFGELYYYYSDVVYRYTFYRVGDQALADDIVSETFLRAFRRIAAFNWQSGDIGAWFVTIARTLVSDYARSSRSRLEFPSEDVLAAAETQVVPGPEESMLAIFRNRALLDAVRTLSPDQQECVVLRFLEGLSLRETALVMGRKENAVKALQLRAVRALARHLPPGADYL